MLSSTLPPLLLFLAIATGKANVSGEEETMGTVLRHLDETPPGWVETLMTPPPPGDRNYIQADAFGLNLRWPGGVVVFHLAPSLEACRPQIEFGMRQIEAASCVTFREWDLVETNFVEIKRDDGDEGCYANVGFLDAVFRPGRNLTVHLGSTCCVNFIVVHELLHIIGTFHEQTRPDRDDHIIINWENVQAGAQIQFYKNAPFGGLSPGDPVCPLPPLQPEASPAEAAACYFPLPTDLLGLPYELGSIMHYHPFLFARDPNIPVITDLEGNTNFGVTSVEMRMTQLDAAKLRAAYGCPSPNIPKLLANQEASFALTIETPCVWVENRRRDANGVQIKSSDSVRWKYHYEGEMRGSFSILVTRLRPRNNLQCRQEPYVRIWRGRPNPVRPLNAVVGKMCEIPDPNPITFDGLGSSPEFPNQIEVVSEPGARIAFSAVVCMGEIPLDYALV